MPPRNVPSTCLLTIITQISSIFFPHELSRYSIPPIASALCRYWLIHSLTSCSDPCRSPFETKVVFSYRPMRVSIWYFSLHLWKTLTSFSIQSEMPPSTPFNRQFLQKHRFHRIFKLAILIDTQSTCTFIQLYKANWMLISCKNTPYVDKTTYM